MMNDATDKEKVLTGRKRKRRGQVIALSTHYLHLQCSLYVYSVYCIVYITIYIVCA